MDSIKYDDIHEEKYDFVMSNGLRVIIVPRNDYKKVVSSLSVDFGSKDNYFFDEDTKSWKKISKGMAHFIEHQLFENSELNVLEAFSKNGASINATTSYRNTTFTINTTSNFYKNINLLLYLVFNPTFSEEKINKEKEIILKEMQMYYDKIEWLAYSKLLNNMYESTSIKNDIAGSPKSISNIQLSEIEMCYNKFYQCSNMVLVLVGPINIEDFLSNIYMPYPNRNEQVKTLKTSEKENVIKSFEKYYFSVSRPYFYTGFKLNINSINQRLNLKTELSLEISLDILVEELSNYGFSLDYIIEINNDYSFVILYCNKFKITPNSIDDYIKETIKYCKQNNFLKEVTNKFKKKKRAELLKQFNSSDWLSKKLINSYFKNQDFLAILSILNSISSTDILNSLLLISDFNKKTTLLIEPF
ncbi:EF-P 5-aminopentanol modification-associated protein YfmH [Staphylococcus arlettae]|uniref:EF-P 5-aminopentanol modification-associated protein YfmH n=1 Tax=Staphylococcus arlettae TaxID=29378 RepID=UPI003F56A02A